MPAAWRGLVDDAAIFPPGDLPLGEAAAAHRAHRDTPYADLVGSFVVRDTDLPALKATPLVLSVVVTGGAGQVAGTAGLARKLHVAVAGVEIALRDPEDPVGAARRVGAAVDAARSDGLLDEEVPVYVELPHVGSTGAWLAAADEVAAREFRLKFRTGGLEAGAFPAAHALARWIDAALDRETPFKCTAGLHNAIRHTGTDGFEHHGFLNVLAATRLAFDGTPLDEVVGVLEERSPAAVVETAAELDLAGARRWFTSFGSCSVSEPLDDLLALGLLENA
ncbi:hypothetical protein GON03_15250 [Nocardioides sp. MAH-18]|uniref:Uncharacterized protein n=1 Tax=Nocardioides agri TaxID=2682843 RepID=A0A6L6XUV0_9ACTN|nr:hypothetical protein [Nocardioides sp. MAH-18]MBA2955692.1 hypothetical protein [Nocardioides sp. CGMCC 1.13656]MVQ50542.1 hypothetical protein [Nocardioides sp. MAH-18]